MDAFWSLSLLLKVISTYPARNIWHQMYNTIENCTYLLTSDHFPRLSGFGSVFWKIIFIFRNQPEHSSRKYLTFIFFKKIFQTWHCSFSNLQTNFIFREESNPFSVNNYCSNGCNVLMIRFWADMFCPLASSAFVQLTMPKGKTRQFKPHWSTLMKEMETMG